MDPSAGAGAAHVGSTLIIVGVMNWLKNSRWFPLLKDGQKIVNRTVSIFSALAVQLGISYQWSVNALGGHNLLIAIPTFSVILIGLFHWASQYLYQELSYQGLSGLLALKDIAKYLGSTLVQAPGKSNAEAALQVTPVGK
jgi:hypothetical protein